MYVDHSIKNCFCLENKYKHHIHIDQSYWFTIKIELDLILLAHAKTLRQWLVLSYS